MLLLIVVLNNVNIAQFVLYVFHITSFVILAPSSSFNLSNRDNDKVTVYKSNISRSLKHRKAVHSTNTRAITVSRRKILCNSRT